MSPIELSYSLNGKEVDKVVAEDGVVANLGTPAGVARAKVEVEEKSWFNRMALADRVGSLFPSDLTFVTYSTRADGLNYRVNSIFDLLIPSIRKLLKAKEVIREKKYATIEGEVIITATAYNNENKNT